MKTLSKTALTKSHNTTTSNEDNINKPMKGVDMKVNPKNLAIRRIKQTTIIMMKTLIKDLTNFKIKRIITTNQTKDTIESNSFRGNPDSKTGETILTAGIITIAIIVTDIKVKSLILIIKNQDSLVKDNTNKEDLTDSIRKMKIGEDKRSIKVSLTSLKLKENKKKLNLALLLANGILKKHSIIKKIRRIESSSKQKTG